MRRANSRHTDSPHRHIKGKGPYVGSYTCFTVFGGKNTHFSLFFSLISQCSKELMQWLLPCLGWWSISTSEYLKPPDYCQLKCIILSWPSGEMYWYWGLVINVMRKKKNNNRYWLARLQIFYYCPIAFIKRTGFIQFGIQLKVKGFSLSLSHYIQMSYVTHLLIKP